MTTGCRKQNASWRAKIPIRYWKIKVSRIICKKKKLKTHSTLCREPQGPLTYQVERLILKNCHQQTFGWLQGITLFEWTCFHDEKQAFFLPSRSESFHFPFHKFHSSRESQALLFSLCVELSYPCWDSVFCPSVTSYSFSIQTNLPSSHEEQWSRGRVHWPYFSRGFISFFHDFVVRQYYFLRTSCWQTGVDLLEHNNFLESPGLWCNYHSLFLKRFS